MFDRPALQNMAKKSYLILLALLLCLPVHAEDNVKPDWTNLTRTLVRFGALSFNDDKVLDEYAAISECDLYTYFHADDFQWNKVRTLIRQSVKQNVATYPTSYSYETKLQLDRYDFQNKLFRFTKKSTLRGVNTFLLYNAVPIQCKGVMITIIPRAFRVVLDTPFTVEGLPLSQKDAEGLLQLMTDSRNDDRIVFTRVNFTVVYIDPLHQDTPKDGATDTDSYSQANVHDSMGAVRLDARLNSINFYADESMTKLIYTFQ
jgi:hypothetical protein